jgi:hypothetical protein
MTPALTLPSVPDLLADIATLLTDPARWTQGAFARTATGRGCDPRDPEAVCWDMLGGGWKVLAGTGLSEAGQSWLIQQMRAWLHATLTASPNPFWFNDHSTHAEMLAALRHTREVVLASEQEEPPDATTQPADDDAASHPV